MNFFSLRMKRGKGGDDNPVVLRQYIHDHGKIGIGALDETRGSGTFESMQIGDIVIVLSQSRPLVMVLIKSPSTAYKATSQSPEFNWLAHERYVKISLFTRICGRTPVLGVRQAGDISTLLQF